MMLRWTRMRSRGVTRYGRERVRSASLLPFLSPSFSFLRHSSSCPTPLSLSTRNLLPDLILTIPHVGTIDVFVQRESVVTVEEAEEGDDLYLQPRARSDRSAV
jgi:hypothetical protein